ncbi:MAG TPA: DNA-processing protein DprA, partial [Myxococcales bacterium]|nr:DNA-processing protein DprA [Myxococcales bacterium]
ALDAGGRAIAVLPGDLERVALEKGFRGALERGLLTLLSPYDPGARFTVWSAMDRNKDVYALSDFGIVVSSDRDKGGTWAGALENLKANWVPLLVRRDPAALPGNEELLARGGIPLTASEVESATDWVALLRNKVVTAPVRVAAPAEQPELPI